MPIYEFKCHKCENVFEYLCINSNDGDSATCPSCGGKNTEKMLSTFSSVSSSSSSPGLSSCSPSGGFS